MTEEDGKKDCKGHQHYVCVECGSEENIALIHGMTVCRKCIENFKKMAGLKALVFDEVVAYRYKQEHEITNKFKEMETEKDKASG
jgi:ribosomal protein L37AE/L43A